MTSTDVTAFISDPVEYFDWSITKLWSMPDDEIAAYQLAGLKQRFEEMRHTIPYLKKLADRDKIDSIETFNDIIPLLFEHTVYKSYPASLLTNNKFTQLNAWLEKLTTISLRDIDVSSCDSIDSWLDVMDRESSLTIHQSSGTSGTVSMFPKSKKEIAAFAKFFALRFQTFGDPRPSDPTPKAHMVLPSYRSGGSAHFRINAELFKLIAHGDESYMHVALPGRMSSDILYLAGRIRAAKARGELDRLVVAPEMMARLEEFETSAPHRNDLMREFLEEVTTELAGERVFMACAPTYLYPLAQKALAQGKTNVFAADSCVSTGGGAKGIVLPDDWRDQVKKFAGVSKIPENYGMTEMNATNLLCERGNYHFVPSVIPFLLDPEDSTPLPRTGTVTGRLAIFDLLPDVHWGGFISGDEVTVTWDKPCGCGRTGIHASSTVGRYSEMQGGDDKISCAASYEAHEEAMDFLSEVHAAAVG